MNRTSSLAKMGMLKCLRTYKIAQNKLNSYNDKEAVLEASGTF